MKEDSAKGPGSGYIFQFEIALLELSKLKPNESITIEKIDDVGKEDENGTYTLTVQAKHSITSTNKTFGNTSLDLWKTLNIWVYKVEKGILNERNIFRAITNVNIPNNSIVRDFNNNNFKENIQLIEKLLETQKTKRDNKLNDGKKAKSIIKTIDLIEKVLEKKGYLKIVLENFEYQENFKIEDDFYNEIHLSFLANNNEKEEIYHRFYGWIIQKSKEQWCNDREALFSKEDFERKLQMILKNHKLINAIFRSKKRLEDSQKINVDNKRDDLYIRQLIDINRNDEIKEEIIKEAILDFILCDIEITHHIVHNKYLTKNDFEDFEERCFQKWKEVRRKHIIKNANDYNDDELNELSIKICDEILTEVKLNFQELLQFDDTNKYIQNGTFLNLSNKPKIGWNPNWKNIYK